MRHSKRRRKGSIATMAELAIAAPQVAAIRTARMVAAGANPVAADRVEFSRMCTEKVQAFWESMFAMNAQLVRTQQEYARGAALQWLRLWATPYWVSAYAAIPRAIPSLPVAPGLNGPTRRQHQRAIAKVLEAGLSPVHKRATENARRLGRIKKR